jgi:hypothetical protein
MDLATSQQSKEDPVHDVAGTHKEHEQHPISTPVPEGVRHSQTVIICPVEHVTASRIVGACHEDDVEGGNTRETSPNEAKDCNRDEGPIPGPMTRNDEPDS